MESESVLLKKFERDSEWFNSNIVKLQKTGFVGKFVAVKDSKPFLSDKNIDVVIKEIEKRGENPSLVFIEFVYPEGYTLIL